MSIFIFFIVILAIGYALDQLNNQRELNRYIKQLSENDEVRPKVEFIRKEYNLNNIYHGKEGMNVNEHYNFNQNKIIDVKNE